MLVCELNGPDTGAATNIEDSLHIFRDRRPEELSVQGQTEGVMLKIQSVRLNLKGRLVFKIRSGSPASFD